MSVIDQLKELDRQREQLITKAKDEALKKAQDAIADLNALGFNYVLAENSLPPSQSTTTCGRRKTSQHIGYTV